MAPNLVATGSIFGLLAIVTFVLGVAGVTSFTWFVGFLIGTIVSLLLFRRSVS
jgi:hypothetical protein